MRLRIVEHNSPILTLNTIPEQMDLLRSAECCEFVVGDNNKKKKTDMKYECLSFKKNLVAN